jgi:hypothetical protein
MSVSSFKRTDYALLILRHFGVHPRLEGERWFSQATSTKQLLRLVDVGCVALFKPEL